MKDEQRQVFLKTRSLGVNTKKGRTKNIVKNIAKSFYQVVEKNRIYG